MIADQPLDHLVAGPGGRRAAGRRRGGSARAGRGVHRAGAWLRPAQHRWWLAVLLPRGVRADRRAVRHRRPAGPADAGRARDARRRGLPAAGQPRQGVRDPWGQRRRRHPHAGVARARRGGGLRRRDGCAPLPDHELLPRADGPDQPRRAARDRAVPARRWPRSRASWRSWSSARTSVRRAIDRPRGGPDAATARGRRRAGVTEVRLQKVLAASGIASRRKCETLMSEGRVEVDGRGHHPARRQGRPRDGGDPGRRQAAARRRVEGLPRREQATRRRQLDGRRGGAP